MMPDSVNHKSCAERRKAQCLGEPKGLPLVCDAGLGHVLDEDGGDGPLALHDALQVVQNAEQIVAAVTLMP
jgi:hypothetical protein